MVVHFNKSPSLVKTCGMVPGSFTTQTTARWSYRTLVSEPYFNHNKKHMIAVEEESTSWVIHCGAHAGHEGQLMFSHEKTYLWLTALPCITSKPSPWWGLLVKSPVIKSTQSLDSGDRWIPEIQPPRRCIKISHQMGRGFCILELARWTRRTPKERSRKAEASRPQRNHFLSGPGPACVVIFSFRGLMPDA